MLNDEDFKQLIENHLMEESKEGYIRAQDIVDTISEADMQHKLGANKTTITLLTAQCWLKNLNWCYGQPKKGM